MADKIMRHLMDQRGELLRISQLVIDRDMTCARVIKAAKRHGIYIPFLDLNADVLTVACGSSCVSSIPALIISFS